MTSAGGAASADATYGQQLDATLGSLAVLVKGFEPDRFSGSDACRLVELFAWGERLCATAKGLAAKRVFDTGAWEGSGERTAADWLASVSGQTAGQAAAAIKNARRMKSQPDVEAAAREGRLSEQQAAAVSAGAEKAPEKAAELLDKSQTDNLASLRERSRDIQLAADEAAEKDRHKEIHAGRYLRFWSDIDGSARMSGRFTPESAAAVINALVPFQDEVFDIARRLGLRERRECHAADALVAMAHAAMSEDVDDDTAHEVDHCEPETNTGCTPGSGSCSSPGPGSSPGSGSGSGSSSGSDSSPGSGSGSGSGSPCFECDSSDDGGLGLVTDRREASGASGVADPHRPGDRERQSGTARQPGARIGARRPATTIIRIDLAALQRGARTNDEVCEIEGVGTVAVATARSLMTESFLTAVVTDGIDIRTVVHLGRTVTARQRTAIIARDVECVVPGCHVRTGLEIDHVEDWTLTRVTRIDALARLCHHHHQKKTYGGWRLTGPPGAWRWLPPPEKADAAATGRRDAPATRSASDAAEGRSDDGSGGRLFG